jgi:glycosyltransferase involved in cell wall biosynthesis
MERRKKVLWFVTPLDGAQIMGGTLGRIVKWYGTINHDKYEVHVLLSGAREETLRAVQAEYAKKGIPVDVIAGLRLPSAFFSKPRKEFLEYVRSIQPDLIHTLFIQSDLIAAYFKPKMAVGSVVSSLEGAPYPKGNLKSLAYRCLYRLLRHRLDRVIGLCRFTRDQAVGEYGVLADRCQLIYSGIDASAFRFPKTIRELPERIKIGFLGYIGAGKRIDLFVDAVVPLVKANDNLRFIVGGVGTDLDRIVAKARRLGIASHVEFRGFVADVPAFFDEIDLYVFLSEREGLPWVVLESQAAGVPTIASPVGGVPEVITDGHNGMLLREHSVEELCEKISTLVDRAALRQQFSVNSRRNVERRFTAEREIREIEAVYDDVIERGVSRVPDTSVSER